MNIQVGDRVERRYGRDDSRFGTITGRVHDGYDTWYVTTDEHLTYVDNARDLRLESASSDEH